MASIFITDTSRGLGLALTRHYLELGDSVFSLGRSACPIDHPRLQHAHQDLSRLESIPAALDALLPHRLDLVILNAGILGEIEDLSDTPMTKVDKMMNVNVWSNKVITDWLIRRAVPVDQLIYLSSGASVNGNRGWGMYSISKASINMMARLYAQEMPHTHITALAPGLVQTRMMDYLCHDVDPARFTSMQNLIDAERCGDIPTADRAAALVAASLDRCRNHPSGSFVDTRNP